MMNEFTKEGFPTLKPVRVNEYVNASQIASQLAMSNPYEYRVLPLNVLDLLEFGKKGDR